MSIEFIIFIQNSLVFSPIYLYYSQFNKFMLHTFSQYADFTHNLRFFILTQYAKYH